MLLGPLTTLKLGGPAADVVEARTEGELVDAVAAADAAGRPVLVLGGGSNVVIADDGFPGTVVRVLTRGVEQDGSTLVTQAGESWERFVTVAVRAGLAGVEALSGVPGTVGAVPIQNVGAYGQDVAETITSVRAYDRQAGEVVTLGPAELDFGYRTSALKRDPDRHVVLSVAFRLEDAEGDSRPVRYAELARALDVPVGGRTSLGKVRQEVLALRRSKGMVLDDWDPDTVSAGSFFTNPILTHRAYLDVEARVARRLGPDAKLPAYPEPDGRLKTSAAWLIERAGFRKGHGSRTGIAISGKHVLALTNRGEGTTRELVALAQEIAEGVRDTFGVTLTPEPVFVGHAWPGPTAPGAVAPEPAPGPPR